MGIFDISFPNLPLTNLLCLILIGYSVVRRQIFNPLVTRNRQLTLEIKQRKDIERELQHSLDEKQVLLKEIHHRVKNNLQIISSLLSLQGRKSSLQEVQRIIDESKSRISSMAIVHEHLYRSDNFSRVNFNEYTRMLLRELSQLHGSNRLGIDFKIDIQDIRLSIDQAIPVGLILNEVLTNSLKYAFPVNYKGTPVIEICISENKDKRLLMIIRDNGVGLPGDFTEKSRQSLGMQIIEMIANHQLDGSYEIDGSDGTEFRLNLSLTEKSEK